MPEWWEQNIKSLFSKISPSHHCKVRNLGTHSKHVSGRHAPWSHIWGEACQAVFAGIPGTGSTYTVWSRHLLRPGWGKRHTAAQVSSSSIGPGLWRIDGQLMLGGRSFQNLGTTARHFLWPHIRSPRVGLLLHSERSWDGLFLGRAARGLNWRECAELFLCADVVSMAAGLDRKDRWTCIIANELVTAGPVTPWTATTPLSFFKCPWNTDFTRHNLRFEGKVPRMQVSGR